MNQSNCTGIIILQLNFLGIEEFQFDSNPYYYDSTWMICINELKSTNSILSQSLS